MNKFIATVAILLLSCLALGSCQNKSEESEKGRVIHVDIEPQEVAVEDLFDRIEVVPLETNDSSLIYYIYNSCVSDSDIYVQDFRAMVVYRFGADGKFKNRIGRIGQGPGEFSLAYGFDRSQYNDHIYIISAFGKVHEYTPAGEFIEDYNLPRRPAYHNIKLIDDSTFMTWSSSDFGEEPVTVLNADFDSVLYLPQMSNHLADISYSDPNFFNFEDLLHIGLCYNRKVYAITRDSTYVEYEWDFGERNLPEEVLTKHDIDPNSVSLAEAQDRSEKFHKDLSITSFLYGHGSNGLYDYVTYRDDSKSNGKDNNLLIHYKVFRDKKTGKNIVFDKLSNGMIIKGPMVMTEDYILYQIPWRELPLYEEYLPEGMKLSDIDPDDDNPVLARFYFKK